MNISKMYLDGEFRPEMLRYCFHNGAGTQQRKQATSDFSQQGKLSGQATDLVNSTQAKTGALVNDAQGTYGQFEGPVQNSPFYKSLLTSGIQDTSRAYETAQSNATARARDAGFGYSSPVAQGANTQLKAEEGSALARVPQEAMAAAAPLSLEAAKGSTQAAGTVGSVGNQGAGIQAGMADSYGSQGTSMINAAAARTPIWQSLLQSGISAASGLGSAYLARKK